PLPSRSFTISSPPPRAFSLTRSCPVPQQRGGHVLALGSDPPTNTPQPHLQRRAGPGSPATRRVFLHPARRRTRPLSPGAGRGSPDTMAVSGAWPQPKIRPTLLLLLVASASAQTPPEPKDASPGTSEKSRHIGTGPETTSPCAEIASNSTEPCAELTRNSPDLSAELTRNNSDLSAELASNSTEPSAELASNST
ncbi:hypothetical protein G0U57_003183, partial [Chelydra serpentina]